MNVNILVETEGLPREDWLAYRRMGIGGSDVAPLLGISKWKSSMDLWLEKTGQVENTEEENEAMTWGSLLEPVIRDHFAAVTGKRVIEVKAILQNPEYPFMLANVDGVTTDDNNAPAILEIKTTSAYLADEWENDVPIFYQVQCQHYMAVTGVQTCYVAVLIGGNRFLVFQLDADKDVQRMLIALEQDFWAKVTTETRPEIDGSNAAADWLSRTYPGGVSEPLTLPQEAAETIEEYIAAAAEEDSAKARKQAAANRLKDLMGNHEKAVCDGHTLGWKVCSRESLDTKALTAEHPEIVEKYTRSTSYRRFTVK